MASGTVVKHSEELKRAIRWISERRQQDPEVSLQTLLSEAGPRFNLTPKDQEGLWQLLFERQDQP
jgi:hypothetical protein